MQEAAMSNIVTIKPKACLSTAGKEELSLSRAACFQQQTEWNHWNATLCQIFLYCEAVGVLIYVEPDIDCF